MKFDPTVNIPTLIAALSLALAGAAAWSNSNERHARTEARLDEQERTARQMEERITTLLRDFKTETGATLADLRTEIRDLRRVSVGNRS